MGIGFLQCGPGLRANRCDVIARKFMALYDHLVCLLREFLRRINQHTRDCLTDRALGLRSLPGKSLSTCSSKLRAAVSLFISATGRQWSVSTSKIVSCRGRRFASVLPNPQGQTNFVNHFVP